MLQAEVSTWDDVAPELDERFGSTFSYLARIFRSRGFRPDEADDLAQETILRTLTHLRRHGRRAENLTPLLHTVAKNLIVERFRTGGREVAVAIDERIPAIGPDPEEQALTHDRARLVNQAIQELPAKQRRAILLWLEGLTAAEIAVDLGIKRNAVDVLLHRSRRYLATRLDDVRDSAWSAGLLLWNKMRRVCYRATRWSYSADPMPIGTAIAVVTTAALLSVVAPSLHASRNASRSSVIAARHASVANVRRSRTHDLQGASPISGPRHGSTAGGNTHAVQVTVRDPSVHVKGPAVKSKDGGKEPIVWLNIWEDPQHSGPIEQKVEGQISAACDRAPTVCGGN